MTKAQHIPGPWRVNSMTRIEAANYGLIASIRGDLIDPTTTANARLIASAPELLEAAKCVVREEERLRALAKQPGISPEFLQAWDAVSSLAMAARIAIDKATGTEKAMAA